MYSKENFEVEQKIVNCSGCGKPFWSIRPNNYYHFCSVECRRIVEDQSEDFIDQQHTIRLAANPEWVITKLKSLANV